MAFIRYAADHGADRALFDCHATRMHRGDDFCGTEALPVCERRKNSVSRRVALASAASRPAGLTRDCAVNEVHFNLGALEQIAGCLYVGPRPNLHLTQLLVSERGQKVFEISCHAQ